MAEPVTLTLKISKDTSGDPTRNHPDPNHPGKYLHPVLHKDDTLKLHTTTTYWPKGISRIEFYDSETDYQAGTTFATWQSGTTEIKKGVTRVFSVTEVKTGGIVTDVKLHDTETLASGEDQMYYKVFLRDAQDRDHPLDPEVINKSGTGTGNKGDHWVSSTT